MTHYAMELKAPNLKSDRKQMKTNGTSGSNPLVLQWRTRTKERDNNHAIVVVHYRRNSGSNVKGWREVVDSNIRFHPGELLESVRINVKDFPDGRYDFKVTSKLSGCADVEQEERDIEIIPFQKRDEHNDLCEVCVCCDWCILVFHTKCIGLQEVPEGSWYCEECCKPEASTGGVAEGASSGETKKRGRPRKGALGAVGANNHSRKKQKNDDDDYDGETLLIGSDNQLLIGLKNPAAAKNAIASRCSLLLMAEVQYPPNIPFPYAQ